MERIEGASLRPRLDAARCPSTRSSRSARAWPRRCTTCTGRPGAPGHQAQQHHVPRRRHRGAGGLRAVAPRQPARPAGRRVRTAHGHQPVHVAEQVQFVRIGTRAATMFALGVMLYHFTTGQRPSACRSVRGCANVACGRRCRRAQTPDCPPWLQEVILQCLEVDPRSGASNRRAAGAGAAAPHAGGADRARRKAATDSRWQGLKRRCASATRPTATAAGGQPAS